MKRLLLLIVPALLALACGAGNAPEPQALATREATYADYVWPPPPDQPRIQLVDVLSGRVDVEAESKLQTALIGASPQSIYDRLSRPTFVEIDGRDRILVSDLALGAVIRFDRAGRRMDVLGTTGPARLKNPLGLGMGPDDTVYVADSGNDRVVSLDADGKVKGVFGHPGDLVNPVDAAVSPDGARLYVSDSKAHQIVVYEIASGKLLSRFGRRGEGPGELAFPTGLAFGPDGDLYVVDQLNSRIQIFSPDGEFVDGFGQRGVGFGDFVRPKDVAVDPTGLVFVTDAAFNNFQIFDPDFELLTFVGEGGSGPGQFNIASGIAIRGGTIAVVDQLNKRVEIFRWVGEKGGGNSP